MSLFLLFLLSITQPRHLHFCCSYSELHSHDVFMFFHLPLSRLSSQFWMKCCVGQTCFAVKVHKKLGVATLSAHTNSVVSSGVFHSHWSQSPLSEWDCCVVLLSGIDHLLCHCWLWMLFTVRDCLVWHCTCTCFHLFFSWVVLVVIFLWNDLSFLCLWECPLLCYCSLPTVWLGLFLVAVAPSSFLLSHEISTSKNYDYSVTPTLEVCCQSQHIFPSVHSTWCVITSQFLVDHSSLYHT